jgi:hypothetical protein
MTRWTVQPLEVPPTRNHQVAPPGTTDLELIKNPHYWPHSRLALKRSVPPGPGARNRRVIQVAVLHHEPHPDGLGQGSYSLCLDTTVLRDSAPEDGVTISPEEVIQRGWKVD